MSESVNQVILNFLDRMIDENVRFAEALSALRSVIGEHRSEQKESIADVLERIEKIEHHFSNGFKSEIKEHVSAEAEAMQIIFKEIKDMLETEEEKKSRAALDQKIDKFIDKISSPKFWATLAVSFVVAISTIIGGAATAWSKISPYLEKKPVPIVQPHTPNTPTDQLPK
jgi:VIT1/CCC1 family predicted Fe2+/Mn2+ transporter